MCICGSAKSYRKLADLRLRNTSCSFAELSVNLRCPALLIIICTRIYVVTMSVVLRLFCSKLSKRKHMSAMAEVVY